MPKETNQDILFNSFFAPKLVLDLENSAFSKEKPMLKNMLNGSIEGWNGQGFYTTQEYSNKLCYQYPEGYELAGKVKLNNDEYVLLFKTKTSSEIGLLNTINCTYTLWVNNSCLNFNPDHWITGVYKFNNICNSRTIYIVDGYNPDRIINIDNPYPKKVLGHLPDECSTPVLSNELDCNELLANTKIKFPCIQLTKSTGNLPDGKYRVGFTFSDNGESISDAYISQEIILVDNDTNGLTVTINNIDTNNSHYNLYLLQSSEAGNNNYLVGTYNVSNNSIRITNTSNYTPVSTQELFSVNTHYLTSDHITVVSNQLVKASLTEHRPIYYQKSANKIVSNWTVTRIKASRAAEFPTFLRDEVYGFNIEWITTDGYIYPGIHIPNTTKYINDSIVENKDVFEKTDVKYNQIYNTAKITDDFRDTFKCGEDEKLILKGAFAQFESFEKYPDAEFVYNNKTYKFFDKLACTNIKLHKFPDNTLTNHFYKCEGCDGIEYIDVLGVEFSNIERPRDLDGSIIEDIIGYRITRFDRAGNETILSKGLFSNMLYDEKENSYFPNFPYNDLNPNKYISKKQVDNPILKNEINFEPFTKYSNSKFTYNSPETSYTIPQKGSEVKLYGEHIGCVEYKVEEVYKHPKFKLLTDFSYFLSGLIGTAVGTLNYKGTTSTTTTTNQQAGTLSGSTLTGGSSTGGVSIVLNNPANAAVSYVPTVVAIEIISGEYYAILNRCDGTGATTVTLTLLDGLPLVATGAGTGCRIKLLGAALVKPDGIYSQGRFTAVAAGAATPGTGLSIKSEGSSVSNTKDTSIQSVVRKNGGLNPLNIISNIIGSIAYAMEGMHTTLNLIKSFNKFKQYAYQINSVSTSLNFEAGNVKIENSRRQIINFGFLQRNKETIGNTRINNLNRNSTVFVELNADLLEPLKEDNSRILSSEIDCKTTSNCCFKNSVNYYGAIKVSNSNPYGALTNNKVIPISCWNYPDLKSNTYSTSNLFGGDNYISKFTFKNHFPLFLDITVGEENGFEIDYSQYYNIGFTRFWANSTDMEAYELINLDINNLTKSLANLDCPSKLTIDDIDPTNLNLKDVFIKDGKFYLSVNGVYSFYVESTYINDIREKSDNQGQLHYPLSDFNLINRSDNHKYDNFFTYQQFLRLSTLYPQNTIQTEYTPDLCNKADFKIVYSNYSNNQDKFDGWRVFKPLSSTQLNKENGTLTSINSFDENTLMLFFEDAVLTTQPDETLLTKSGNNVFIGSGDIFSRKLKKLIYDDTGYTGCIDKYSILNTKHGITWVDRKRKKIFNYSSKLEERSAEEANQWLQTHLENKQIITHKDSFKTVYDNHYDKIYYTNDTDSDCSWTLSYKPGSGWNSFHSFIPLDYFSLSNDYMSSNKDGIWMHNDKSSYQTYYGKQYPYNFTYIVNSAVPMILQSLEIRNEVTTEVNSYNQIFHNNIFFNKMNIYTDYSNTGLLDIIVKDPNHRQIELNQTNKVLEYNGKCVTTPIEGNYWRLNKFRNFAISQPHVSLNCDGNTVTYTNINPVLDPKLAGNIRGNWAALTLINDAVFDKRFKTFFSVQTISKINR